MWRRPWSKVLGLVAACVLATAASCGEDPRQVSFTFVNETDRHISYIVASTGQTLETAVDRRVSFPPLLAPGEITNANAQAPSIVPEDGEPWCPGARTYYFISPKDPTASSWPLPTSTQPELNLDEVDILHVLEAPCWPEQSGNRYSVTDDGN